MLVKRKLYSVIDEEGNQGYYLYDESTGEEKLFSVVEEDERLFAKNGKKALKYVDVDFLEENEQLKKSDRRSTKAGLALTGGMLGTIPGAIIAERVGHASPMLAVPVAGATAGYLIGKKLGKKSDKKYDKFRELYENSDEKTREYLRHKREKELDRRNMMNAAAMGGYIDEEIEVKTHINVLKNF